MAQVDTPGDRHAEVEVETLSDSGRAKGQEAAAYTG